MTDFFNEYKEFTTLLDNHPVVFIGLGAQENMTCPLCADSAAALAQNEVEYTYVNAHNNPALIDCIAKKAPIASVPYLFIKGKPYGGYDEIREGLATGELVDLV